MPRHDHASRPCGTVLTATVLVPLGVWLGFRSVQDCQFWTSTHRPPDDAPTAWRARPSLLPDASSASTPVAALADLDATKLELVQHACRHVFVPLNPSCPRQLIVKYLESAGFGHQFTELLFAMYAAQYLGLTFTWNPITSSQDHDQDYSSLVETLGLEQLFLEGLKLASAGDLRQLRQHQENASLFGQWIDSDQLDKRALGSMSTCDNSVLSIEGWWHCRGVAENNCFWAPEHAFLFQRYGACLRAGVEIYGTTFDRCVFVEEDEEDGALLPRDALVVAWHLRFGDAWLVRKPDDVFFANVVRALTEILPEGMFKRVRIVLVGGGKETTRVPDRYVNDLRGVVDSVFMSSKSDIPSLQVERFNDTSFEAQFIAMMQADVLIGSGSSVPQVAALLSGRPLFLNHVAKHGYVYGQEAMADAVDMDEHGRALDSLRRVKVMLYERMMRAGLPCRGNR